MTSMNLRYIAILNMKGSNYHCIISLFNKNEAINLCKMGKEYLTFGNIEIEKIKF